MTIHARNITPPHGLVSVDDVEEHINGRCFGRTGVTSLDLVRPKMFLEDFLLLVTDIGGATTMRRYQQCQILAAMC